MLYSVRQIYDFTWRELGWGESDRLQRRYSRDYKSKYKDKWQVVTKDTHYYNKEMWIHNRTMVINGILNEKTRNGKKANFIQSDLKRLFRDKGFFVTMDFFFNHLKEYGNYIKLLKKQETKYLDMLNNVNENEPEIILQRIFKDTYALSRFLYLLQTRWGYLKSRNYANINVLHNNVFGLKTMRLTHTIFTISQIKAMVGLWDLRAELSKFKSRYKGKIDTNAKVGIANLRAFLANPAYYDARYSVYFRDKTYKSLWL